MRGIGRLRQGIGAAVAGLALAAAAGAAERTAFEVAVSLTPAAIDDLKRWDRRILVSAWYFADPKPGAEAAANPVGLIDLAVEEHDIGSFGGTVRVTGEGIDPADFALIGGPLYVNVNIMPANPDGENRLDCDFFDGLLTRATAAPVRLRCGLVDEHIGTRALP